MRKKFWLLLVPVLLAAAFLSSGCMYAVVGQVVQVCSATSPGSVDATFNWMPATKGNGTQYVDLSLYSTFPAGAFYGNGPLDAGVNSVGWPSLAPNTVHHWRVDTLIDGNWHSSYVGTFTTIDCGTGNTAAPTANMRMVIPRIGVDAPINVRIMGADGQMGIPNGKDDVIWYDFQNFPGMGGFPGTPGSNVMFSGHVDYHPNFEAVFWNLHLLGPGDEIDVVLLDGSTLRYAVDWGTWISPDDNFSVYAMKNGFDMLTIVTCIGTFDSTTRHYSNRYVVRASLIH
jgi:hypothetical protein